MDNDDDVAGYYARKFVQNIRNISQNSTRNAYLTEWVLLTTDTEPNIAHPDPDTEDWECSCERYKKPNGTVLDHYKCICSNCILEVAYLKNIITGDVVMIGCKCTLRYLNIKIPSKKTKKCEMCGEPHRRRNGKQLCKKCEKLYVITFGEHKGKSFRNLLENERKYCWWVLFKAEEKPHYRTSNDFLFLKKWLQKNYVQ